MEFEGQIPGCSEALPLITAELRRARRYEHRLAAIVMSPDRHPADTARPDLALVGDDGGESLLDSIAGSARGTVRRAELVTRPLKAISAWVARRDSNSRAELNGSGDGARPVNAMLASFLREALRETDILITAPKPLAYAVFLPVTDREGAEHAIVRFRDGFRDRAGVGLRLGCAEFPNDGLTVDDLLKAAVESWESSAEMIAGRTTMQSHG